MEIPAILRKRLIFVIGKGGVGKTTVAAALSLLAGKCGLKTILCEISSGGKVGFLFNGRASTYMPEEIVENVSAINIMPEEALKEYGLMTLKFKTAYRIIFENDFMKRLIDVLPGTKELFMIGKIYFMESEKWRNGRNKWDVVIVDLPATGHGVALLGISTFILKAVTKGVLADKTRGIWELLTDATRTAIVIVSTPEEMPVSESVELKQKVEDEFRFPVSLLVINGMLGANIDYTERNILDIYQESRDVGDEDLKGFVKSALFASIKKEQQEHYARRLRKYFLCPAAEVPFLSGSNEKDKIVMISSLLQREFEKICAQV